MSLTQSQAKVLKALHETDNASYENIGNAIKPPITKNAVCKTLKRLVDKGIVKKKVVYSAYQITPLGFSLLNDSL